MQMMQAGATNPMMYEPDMIGAIKIKDGLFIGDELASTVSTRPFNLPGETDG